MPLGKLSVPFIRTPNKSYTIPSAFDIFDFTENTETASEIFRCRFAVYNAVTVALWHTS